MWAITYIPVSSQFYEICCIWAYAQCSGRVRPIVKNGHHHCMWLRFSQERDVPRSGSERRQFRGDGEYLLKREKIGLELISCVKTFDHQNVSLPALIFSAVVSAFSKDNIASLGPLCLNAIVYQFIGLVSLPPSRHGSHTHNFRNRPLGGLSGNACMFPPIFNGVFWQYVVSSPYVPLANS